MDARGLTILRFSRRVEPLQTLPPFPGAPHSIEILAPPVSEISIPAPTKRVAMDWALVLASQEIEVRIEPDRSRGSRAYCLVVSEGAGQRAMEAIGEYQKENRRSPWRTALDSARVRFHPAVLAWGTLIVMVHWADYVTGSALTRAWASQSEAVARGEWWRLFGAVLLHADIGHLASNLSIGIVLLGLAMGSLGLLPTLLITGLAGAAGNLAGFLIHPRPFTGVGASGMVLAAAGLLAGQAWRSQWFRHTGRGRPWATLCGGICLFVLLGFHPGSDQLAHGIGFLGGFLGGLLVKSTSSTGTGTVPERLDLSSKTRGEL